MIKILFHPFAPFIVTILVVGLWVSFLMTTHEIRQSHTLVLGLKSKVEAQKKELGSLEEKLKNAQTPYAQESVIRNELLLQKPGEYIVQLPDLPSSVLPQEAKQPILTPWEEWKSLFGWGN
jgi:hypothetical protein